MLEPVSVAEATSHKFLSAIEDVITKPTTTPVVRTRVLEVLAGAAHAFPGNNNPGGALANWGREKGGYGALWRKFKPTGAPAEVRNPYLKVLINVIFF